MTKEQEKKVDSQKCPVMVSIFVFGSIMFGDNAKKKKKKKVKVKKEKTSGKKMERRKPEEKKIQNKETNENATWVSKDNPPNLGTWKLL